MSNWRSKVGCTLIMKNEEKVLDRCLSSMKGCWDDGCLLITDTGSVDRSIEIAKNHGAIVEHFEWIKDFGKARQYSLEKLRENCPDIDWWMWMDCDDVLMSPDDVIRYRELLDQYLDDPNVLGLNFPYIYSHEKNEIGNQGVANFKYHRLRCCKAKYGEWKARIHEYITLDPTKQVALKDVIFHHFRDEHLGTLNTKRNLEILRLVVDECTPEERPRTLFYYGKECTYNGLWDEAIKAFEEYIPLSNWIPEKHRAMYELAECYRHLNQYDLAREYAFKAINLDKRYADPWIYLAKDSYEAKDYKMAIAYALMIPQLENPKTLFFDYIPTSTYLPHDYAQASYHFIGNNEKALEHLRKCLSYKPHERRYLKNYSIFIKDTIEKIAIIIPTMNRKERLLNCLTKIKENAYIPYEIFIGVDGNEEYFNELNKILKDEKNVTTILFEKKSTVPNLVEDLVDIAEEAGFKYVSYLGDDTEPLVGFLIHAYEACEGKNLVCYNDKIWNGEVACHWFAPIELREKLGGFFFYRGYQHLGCDNELTQKAKKLGLYKFEQNAYVDHIHCFKAICSEKDKVAEPDECYKLAWSPSNLEVDRKLLEIRQANNWIADTEIVKINVGGGYKTPKGFINLDKYSKTAQLKADILNDDVFLNETVDEFLCEHVLEHFSSNDGAKVIEKLYNALKSGGKLEISVPDMGMLQNVFDEDYRLKVMYGWRNRGEGMFHLFGYTTNSLKQLLLNVGFEIQSIEYPWEYDAPAIRVICIKR